MRSFNCEKESGRLGLPDSFSQQSVGIDPLLALAAKCAKLLRLPTGMRKVPDVLAAGDSRGGKLGQMCLVRTSILFLAVMPGDFS